jgi:hypothetical protein
VAQLRCAWCRGAFAAQRATAKYCSASCRAAASRTRRDPGGAAPGPRRRSTVLAAAVNRAARAAPRTPADAAAVALARLYARTIDADPDQLAKLGPQLLAVLVQLGMTPKAHPATPAGQPAPAPAGAKSVLDELRARRATRMTRAGAPVEPSQPDEPT